MHCTIPDCDPPDRPDKSHGKNCGSNYCINGNRAYPALLEAWTICGHVPDCGFIMRYSDQRYYLRRTSDPDLQGQDGYAYPANCGIHHI